MIVEPQYEIRSYYFNTKLDLAKISSLSNIFAISKARYLNGPHPSKGISSEDSKPYRKSDQDTDIYY